MIQKRNFGKILFHSDAKAVAKCSVVGSICQLITLNSRHFFRKITAFAVERDCKLGKRSLAAKTVKKLGNLCRYKKKFDYLGKMNVNCAEYLL